MSKQFRYLIIAMAIFFTLPPGAALSKPCVLPDFDADNFGSPMGNPYLPIPLSSTTYVYEAEDEDGLIRNYIQFSTDTVTILGITCIVIHDVEWLWLEDLGIWVKLEETEDWHAWDNDGNFWYFGESTTEFEYDDEWELEGENNEGSWTAGVDGALPGIILPADPHPGDCYQQEYYEDAAEDLGKVLRLNADASVEFGDYGDCLVMKEWTPLEPGNVEHKLYAPGEGLVYIKELKEKTVEVELVDINDELIPDPPPDSP